MFKKTLQKIGLPLVALFALSLIISPAPAQAGVRFGVSIGPAYRYPVRHYGYGYAAPYAYGYAAPYDYGYVEPAYPAYPVYPYVAPVYSYGYGYGRGGYGGGYGRGYRGGYDRGSRGGYSDHGYSRGNNGSHGYRR